MTRKESIEMKSELAEKYREAIGDFRKFFENKKKLMKAKNGEEQEDEENQESEET